MAEPRKLTLMAVHAHPDDEASSTGGILAKYAAEGVRTVLVTCTNGELGDGPGGLKPEHDEHDTASVVATRLAELEASCRLLGVSHLELLGYHDSGMMGWPENDAPQAFWNTPVEEAAARLTALMERYRPDVVVTYDENGFYGHPDHIQANRITRAAIEANGIPAKLYYPVIARSDMPRFVELLASAGIEPPPEATDAVDFGVDDALVAARIDCTAYARLKFDALAAHASQGDNVFFLRLGFEIFSDAFGTETFQRAYDRTGHPIPESDLFAGIQR